MVLVQCLADMDAGAGYLPEFGLSLFVEADGNRILFDTGAGQALHPNASHAGLDFGSLTDLVLSHGHYAHTGGLAGFRVPPQVPVRTGKHIAAPCWSLHDDGSKHRIAMPQASQVVLAKCDVREIDSFQEIRRGIFLTGPIPRESGEDCGGRFFSDEACATPNPVPEEIALLLRSGVLITGCCHAGIVNTAEFCREACPGVRIHTILGGLHLKHADAARLGRTADYLNSLGLKRLVPMHCTGADAVRFLRERLTCEVAMLPVGRKMRLD